MNIAIGGLLSKSFVIGGLDAPGPAAPTYYLVDPDAMTLIRGNDPATFEVDPDAMTLIIV